MVKTRTTMKLHIIVIVIVVVAAIMLSILTVCFIIATIIVIATAFSPYPRHHKHHHHDHNCRRRRRLRRCHHRRWFCVQFHSSDLCVGYMWGIVQVVGNPTGSSDDLASSVAEQRWGRSRMPAVVAGLRPLVGRGRRGRV